MGIFCKKAIKPTVFLIFQFKCVSDGTCIRGTAKCNGIEECSDGSDEEKCRESCESYEVSMLCKFSLKILY